MCVFVSICALILFSNIIFAHNVHELNAYYTNVRQIDFDYSALSACEKSALLSGYHLWLSTFPQKWQFNVLNILSGLQLHIRIFGQPTDLEIARMLIAMPLYEPYNYQIR